MRDPITIPFSNVVGADSDLGHTHGKAALYPGELFCQPHLCTPTKGRRLQGRAALGRPSPWGPGLCQGAVAAQSLSEGVKLDMYPKWPSANFIFWQQGNQNLLTCRTRIRNPNKKSSGMR